MADEQKMQESNPPVKGRITSMPDKYLPKEKKQLSLPIILGIVIVAVVLVVGVVLVVLLSRPQSQPVLQQPIVNTPTTTEVDNTEPEVEAPAQPEITEPEPIEEVVKNVGIDYDFSSIGKYQPSLDSDQDGLTDEEEVIFATGQAVPDTDGDSFLDGAEVVNLYDPASSGAFLDISSNVKIAQNVQFGYQFLTPLNWTTVNETPSGESFLIKPLTGTESMRITIYENPEQLTVSNWLQSQVELNNLTQFLPFSNEAGFTGVKSTDNLFFVATIDDGGPGSRALMFVMEYQRGGATQIKYPSVWQMIVNSLAVLEKEDL